MARQDRKKGRERKRLEELLSAYLDGQLALAEQTRLERQLAEDPALRAELEELRHTVSLVAELPELAVPRNFILPRAMATSSPSARPRVARRPLLAPALTAATSLATLLFGIVLTGEMLLSGAGWAPMLCAPVPGSQTEVPSSAPGDGERRPGEEATPTPEAEEATPTKAAAEEGDDVNQVEGEYFAPTPSGEEPIGGGGAPPEGTVEPSWAEGIGGGGDLAATQTPVAVGEADSLHLAPEAEGAQALDSAGRESAAERIAPLWVWRVAEIGLGLGALTLGAGAVWAWRARRG